MFFRLNIQDIPEYMTQFKKIYKKQASKDSTKTQIFSERLSNAILV